MRPYVIYCFTLENQIQHDVHLSHCHIELLWQTHCISQIHQEHVAGWCASSANHNDYLSVPTVSEEDKWLVP